MLQVPAPRPRLYIRCIFIIIAQLRHYLSQSPMPPCLVRSPPAPVGLGGPTSPSPPARPSPPPQLFQVTVITNHDNHSDPWRRLITVVLSRLQTPQCLPLSRLAGRSGDTCTHSYWSKKISSKRSDTREEAGTKPELMNKNRQQTWKNK